MNKGKASKAPVRTNKEITRKRLTASEKEKLIRDKAYDEAIRMVFNSESLSRAALGSRMGMSFEGDRDLYGTFGYPRKLQYEHYRVMYDRNGMGTRIVEKFPDDTWGKPPILIDGKARSDEYDESELTPFLVEWNALVKRVQLWQMMRQVDIMCGIGRYSVLFIGSSGDYKSPVSKGNGNLFYLAAYDEKQAKIDKWISDKTNENFGMPSQYTIGMEGIDGSAEVVRNTPVNSTRCIHVSENRLGSRVYGRPRMQEVFNRLMDLEKVLGGGAEAAWLAIYMGVLLLTREGSELPDENSPEWDRMDEAMQAFAHRIQRYATLTGVDKVENLGVHEVRIQDIWKTLIADFCGSKGIPQRILLGSERGELASSQDMQEWNSVIDSRRKNFAEPELLDPFIRYCVINEIIPAPKSGKWITEWLPVYSPTQVEMADLLLKISQAANAFTGGASEMVMDENEWRRFIKLPARDMQAVLEQRATLDEVVGDTTLPENSDLQDSNPAPDTAPANGNGKKPVKIPAKVKVV